MTSNQRRIREAIAWRRIAFDEFRPPEPPLLMEALPPEMPDGEAMTVPVDAPRGDPYR